jgi:hypothetical protein
MMPFVPPPRRRRRACRNHGSDNVGDTRAEVRVEVAVFSRDNRLAQVRRDRPGRSGALPANSPRARLPTRTTRWCSVRGCQAGSQGGRRRRRTTPLRMPAVAAVRNSDDDRTAREADDGNASRFSAFAPRVGAADPPRDGWPAPEPATGRAPPRAGAPAAVQPLARTALNRPRALIRSAWPAARGGWAAAALLRTAPAPGWEGVRWAGLSGTRRAAARSRLLTTQGLSGADTRPTRTRRRVSTAGRRPLLGEPARRGKPRRRCPGTHRCPRFAALSGRSLLRAP